MRRPGPNSATAPLNSAQMETVLVGREEQGLILLGDYSRTSGIEQSYRNFALGPPLAISSPCSRQRQCSTGMALLRSYYLRKVPLRRRRRVRRRARFSGVS